MTKPEATSRALFGITHGDPPRRDPRRSTYDAAQTDTGNERHWADTDALSGRQANSPDVRKKLRERGRLEFDNGGNCKGAIETVAHDTIGDTGPALQLAPPEWANVPDETIRFIEQQFAFWGDDSAVDFADKLRVKIETEMRDGECYGLLVTNDLIEHPVKLDVRLIETEQVCSPDGPITETARAVDGIEFDRFGNPVRYSILKDHPGDGWTWNAGAAQWWDADVVLHWFRGSRPSHARGIPRITPGLSLIAHKRAYTRSVLGAARIAAMLAGVLKPNLPPDTGPVVVDAYDVVPMDHDGLLTMPAGWEASQFQASQPTATHKEFSDTLMTEFGRSIHAPRNIVTGDSSPYNYSSAKLDHAIYRSAIRVTRNRLAIRVLDRVFAAWFAEAILIPGFIPGAETLPPLSEWSWKWRYPGFESIDPVKDASATEIELRTGMTTYADALRERGVWWPDHFRQIARERELAKELGIEDLLWPDQLPPAPVAPAGPTSQTAVDTVLEEEAAYVR